jgi:hypothetical protein
MSSLLKSTQTITSIPNPEAPGIAKGILKVGELLALDDLTIPVYQRPYKWTARNVSQLFSDLALHRERSIYRLGTIVFHEDAQGRNVVDGQQRTVTLLLAVRALIELRLSGEGRLRVERKDLRKQLEDLRPALGRLSFRSRISKANIFQNYQEIARIVGRSDFSEDHIDHLLNRCEVVTFTLSEISEAFQFFDSQNARGRDLSPHDLLKAYHLREFREKDEALKGKTVERWENSDSGELSRLFGNYLFRIRNWSKGESARYFDKEHVPLFKGVNLDSTAPYPYVGQLRVAHHFVDGYNRSYERGIDGRDLGFPFQIDQIIINGRRFFEMITCYQQRASEIRNRKLKILREGGGIDGFAPAILDTINSYDARDRSGDTYVRTLFDCLLIYYIDRFGEDELSRAIEKIFIWAYTLRLTMQNVLLASMDNYALEKNLFQVVRDATTPAEFLSYSMETLAGVRSRRTQPIENLFREMKYLTPSHD